MLQLRNVPWLQGSVFTVGMISEQFLDFIEAAPRREATISVDAVKLIKVAKDL
jgi:hypothetical protein